MLGDVKHIITDFGLGSSTVKGEGVHIKIGVSHVLSDVPITINGSMSNKDIRAKLGLSPISDSLIDSVNAGAKTIYAVPVEKVTAGTIEKTLDLKGTGTVEVAGSPNNAFDIVVEITSEGDVNVGAFQYYLNGVLSDEYTISENFEIEGTGVILNFTAGSYTIDDVIKITTTRPKMNIMSVLDALEKIKDLNLNFEFIHIVGESEKTLWATLSVEGDKFFDTYYKPCTFVCETRNILKDETIDEYANYLREQKRGIVSRDLQVVSGRTTYMRDGIEIDVNGASIVLGLHARARVHQSIGETRIFDIKGALELRPAGIEAYISELDDLGYTTFRQYIGLEGIYVNNSKTFAKEGSDYAYTERVRPMYKAVRETRKTALLQMHTQVDMSNQEASLKAITEFVNVPVERMVKDKEFSSARVEIPEDQDILGTSKLYFKIRAVPIGILREIEIDMGYEKYKA